MFNDYVQWKKKKAQHESCELSFIWGKMRTIAQETASQMALRNCSKGGGGSVIYDFSEGGTCSQARILAELSCSSQGADVSVNSFSAFPDTRRCKNLGS